MSMNVSPTLLVVDDHESVLGGSISVLAEGYPAGDIRTAATAEAVQAQLAASLPDVLVMDLSIPAAAGAPTRVETGLELLRRVMATYLELNIAVQSAYLRTLIRLKPVIDRHRGGFTVVDKILPMSEMLERVEWALKGVVCISRDLRTGLEVKPEWLAVLHWAFRAGLQDKAIAKQMGVSERTVRHYWSKVQDTLRVYPEAGKNIRIQTEIRARAAGLID